MKESQFQLPPYSQEVTTARSATYLIWPPFFLFYAGVVTLLGDCVNYYTMAPLKC